MNRKLIKMNIISNAQSEGDCNICTHSDICKIIKKIEAIGIPMTVEFYCPFFSEAIK